jgi:thymidylate synthase (FAD)
MRKQKEITLKVTYKDHFGSDNSVVDAARVSFSKEASGYTPEQNNKLIKYLAKHQHKSPFFHTAISLHLKMPIFVARQIMKHTTGIEYNEVSRRYVDSEPEFYVPDVWRKKADNVKQGSSDEPFTDYFYYEFQEDDSRVPYRFQNGVDESIEDVYNLYLEGATEIYDDMLERGIAPEQARMILPQSMYTEVISTGNLYAWANMYIQRTDSHAQKETQDLAKQIGEIIKPLYPVSWAALVA